MEFNYLQHMIEKIKTTLPDIALCLLQCGHFSFFPNINSMHFQINEMQKNSYSSTITIFVQ